MPKTTRQKHQGSQEITLSQSSNVDGGEEAMGLLIKAQATVAKNKKVKEAQCLNGTREMLNTVLQACAQDYAGGMTELESLYNTFQMELAASYDRERKYWLEAVEEQDTFKHSLGELIGAYQENEEARENEHIEALAVARSGMSRADSVVNKHLHQN